MVLGNFFPFFFVFSFCKIFSVAQTTEGSNCPNHNDVNFIVVGAGATGGVVASRLSEVKNFKVLLLEAGPKPKPEYDVPFDFPFSSDKSNKFYYTSEPQKSCCHILNESRSTFYQGKTLGGGTAINAMVFTIGNRRIYDKWEKLGNKGWGFKSVQYYFKKLMDYRIPKTCANSKYYSTGGPVTVSWPPFSTPLAPAYLEAATELGHCFTDVNGENQTGFGYRAMYLKDGIRMGTYNAYIKPASNRTNFIIQTDSYVTRILFNGTRAMGVEYIYNNKTCKAYMDKEVIVSGGAVKSPQILMLSGIGPKATLEAFKIPIVKVLEGVGQHFVDHVGYLRYMIRTTYPASMFEANYDSDENRKLYQEKKIGPLTFNKMEDIGYIESSLAEEGIPDLEVTLEYNGFRYSKVPTVNSSYSDDSDKLKDKNLIFLRISLLQPKSTGYISLKSADPLDQPKIDPNYLNHKDDVKILLEGIKTAEKLVNTRSLKRYGTELMEFGNLPGCDHLTKGSSEYYECTLRIYTGSDLHLSGTCKMGNASDKMAVVDSNLKVYGVNGVRVADASIFPIIPNCHISVPCMMVGEKLADIIKKAYQS